MVALCLSILFLTLSAINIQESHGVMTPNVTGIVTSAFTPFYKNGLVNLDLIPTLAQRYKDNGIKNVLLISYTGEGTSISLFDMKAIVSKWVEAGRPLGLKFLVQVGALPLYDAVELTKYCYELEVAAILMLPVFTYRGNLEEVINDLKIISNAAPEIPLLYEDLTFVTTPQVSSAEVFAAAVKRIRNFGGIMTTMDSALLIKATQSLRDLIVMIIRYDGVAATFATNFNVSVSGAGNLFPKQVLAIEAAYRNNDYEEGEAQQAELNRLLAPIDNSNNSFLDYTSRSYIENEKEAYRLIWGTDLGIRIPLVRTPPAESQRIASSFQSLGVELKGSPLKN